MTDWDGLNGGRAGGGARVSPVRVALLFGSAAVALALIATPMLERGSRARPVGNAVAQGLDFMSTGSTARSGTSYTLRRSVLQASPEAVCVIRSNGAREGSC